MGVLFFFFSSLNLNEVKLNEYKTSAGVFDQGKCEEFLVIGGGLMRRKAL